MLGTEEMKYDIRICGLVTLNRKNGNFEMLLVSRRMKKRDFSDPSSPLSGGLMSLDQHSGRRRPFLTPTGGILSSGFLLVGAENAHSEPKHLNLGSL